MVSGRVQFFSLLPGLALLVLAFVAFQTVGPVSSVEEVPDGRSLVTPHGLVIPLHEIAPRQPVALMVVKGQWCPVCRDQLQRLDSRAGKRRYGQVALVVPGTARDAAAFQERWDLDLPVYADVDAALTTELGLWPASSPHPTPGIVFVDPKGELSCRYAGRRPGQDQTDFIDEMLRRLAIP